MFPMRPAAFGLNFLRPDERSDRKPLTAICTIAIAVATERIGRTFERELDRVRSLGVVRKPESVTGYSPKRRLK